MSLMFAALSLGLRVGAGEFALTLGPVALAGLALAFTKTMCVVVAVKSVTLMFLLLCTGIVVTSGLQVRMLLTVDCVDVTTLGGSLGEAPAMQGRPSTATRRR
jgi:hypothetical protein